MKELNYITFTVLDTRCDSTQTQKDARISTKYDGAERGVRYSVEPKVALRAASCFCVA